MRKFGFVFALSMTVGLGFWMGRFYNQFPGQSASASKTITGPRPASTVFGANADQQEIIDYISRLIIDMKSKDQVLKTVQEIKRIASEPKNRNYPGVQIFGAVADIVPQLEGIVYRMRDIVEPSDWLHMSSLFRLRAFNYNSFVYGQHITAIFDYLTYPSHRVGKPFKNVSELQDFFLNTVAPKMEAALAVSKTLEGLPNKDFDFQFDRTLFVGESSDVRFIDQDETKKTFIKPYFYTVGFLLQRALGTIYYGSAMNLDDLPKFANAVIRKTTINSFTGDLRPSGSQAKGITPQLLVDAISQYPNYLTWKKQVIFRGNRVAPQVLLDKAFEYAVLSAKYQRAGYNCGLSYPLQAEGGSLSFDVSVESCASVDLSNIDGYHVHNGEAYLFNPNSMVLNFKQKYKTFRDRVRVFEGAAKNQYVTVMSDSTGKSIKVFAKAFFKSNVSQRSFLPTGFVNRGASFKVDGLNTYAWDYSYGKPASYKDYTFNYFFDAKEVYDMKSLYSAMSTLMYTDSIAPFAAFIRVPAPIDFVTFTDLINANN